MPRPSVRSVERPGNNCAQRVRVRPIGDDQVLAIHKSVRPGGKRRAREWHGERLGPDVGFIQTAPPITLNGTCQPLLSARGKMSDERIVSGTRNPVRLRHAERGLAIVAAVAERGPEPSRLRALVGVAEEWPHGRGAKVKGIHVWVGSRNRRILKCRPLKLSGRGRQFKYCSQQSAWDLPVHTCSQCVPSGSITCRAQSGRRPRTARWPSSRRIDNVVECKMTLEAVRRRELNWSALVRP